MATHMIPARVGLWTVKVEQFLPGKNVDNYCSLKCADLNYKNPNKGLESLSQTQIF